MKNKKLLNYVGGDDGTKKNLFIGIVAGLVVVGFCYLIF